MKRNITISWVLLAILTLLAAFVFISPILWTISTSFKSELEFLDIDNWTFIPKKITLEHFEYMFNKGHMFTWYYNSIGTSLGVTFFVILISMPCGYALSQINCTGRTFVLVCVVLSIMVPGTALVVALFLFVADLGLINTWAGIILPQVISPVCVIVYKQFFDQVPKELREATLIDGANELQILIRVYMPLNWGITSALALVTFIGAWNNFFWPFIMTTDPKLYTITSGMAQVYTNYGVQHAYHMAMSLAASLPVLVAYLVFQKKITKAIMLSSGIKG